MAVVERGGKLPNHLENHLPTFEALTPAVALTATQTKKGKYTRFPTKKTR
jgi:hypothetical protein